MEHHLKRYFCYRSRLVKLSNAILWNTIIIAGRIFRSVLTLYCDSAGGGHWTGSPDPGDRQHCKGPNRLQ